MPTDVQVILQGDSGLPEDRFINTLHFAQDDFSESNCQELVTKYQTFVTTYIGGISASGHAIKCYAPGVNPGGPYRTYEFTLTGTTGASAPTEIAICLSYATVDDPDSSTPRRRGRIYLGPLRTSAANVARPAQTLRDAVLALGQGIAQVGDGTESTWVMYSQTDNSYHKIESIWVDDAWDTQRRRGLKPTARTVQDVQ